MLNTEFMITSLVVVLIPGTGVIYTISTGLFLGRRESIAAACGCTLGIIPHLVASIVGLSAILHMSSVAFQVVKYLGTFYLLYLAWGMWRETGALSFNSPSSPKGMWQIAVKAVLINILNPKLSLFFLAFLPLFVSPRAASPMIEMFLLSSIFMAMTFVIFALYGILANGVRQYVLHSPRTVTRLQRSFAVVFAALGVKLALAEQ